MKKQKRVKIKESNKKGYSLSKGDLRATEDAAKTLVLANTQLDRIALPHIAIASRLVKQIQESYSIQALENFKKIQEELFAPMMRIQENLRAITEPLTLFKKLMDAELKNLKIMNDMVFNLPLENLSKQFTFNTEFLFEIDSFTKSKDENEYTLSATSISRTDLGIVVFERIDRMEMKLESIEEKQDKTNKDMERLLESSAKKDDVIQELVDFVRKNKSTLVKIKDIKYNERSAALIIKGREICFKRAPNQELLCRFIFKNSTNLKQEFSMENLVKHFSGNDIFSMTPSERDKVTRKIIDTAYNINTKIAKETRIKDFLIPSVKNITINPRVL